MTRKREAALQWFHDRGAVDMRETYADEPTPAIRIILLSRSIAVHVHTSPAPSGADFAVATFLSLA